MLNERIDRLDAAVWGSVQVRFDLSDAQLSAVANAASTIIGERYRGHALDADAVLELRELIALHDCSHERSLDGCNGGTLVLSPARLGLLVGALGDWQVRCDRLGFLRAADGATWAVVSELLEPLAALHARAVVAALADQPLAHSLV